MNWTQIRESLPPLGTSVIVAKKSVYIRPGQASNSTFFCVYLLHPHAYHPEFDRSLHLWCKADLHTPPTPSFDIELYFKEKAIKHLGEMERTYIKMTSLDWWLTLEDPKPKMDFDLE